MRAGAVVCPRRGVQAVADRDLHQLVVRRVVFDLVDAVTVPVVGVQNGAVPIGELAPALGLVRSAERAELGDLIGVPPAALPDERLHQYR